MFRQNLPALFFLFDIRRLADIGPSAHIGWGFMPERLVRGAMRYCGQEFVWCLRGVCAEDGAMNGAMNSAWNSGWNELVLRTVGCRPAGWEVFSFCSIGRLRGVRQGGAGYGASPPSRPPLHPPRSTPFRFSTPPGWRGLRVSCSGSFPPSGRVISLRAAQCHRALLLCMKAVERLPAWGTPQSGNSLFAVVDL